MQTSISGHHVAVTPALNEYILEKLTRLDRHAHKINRVNVILSVEKLQQKAESMVRINGSELFAHADSEDMYEAIDALSHRQDRQISKAKDKMQRKH